MTRNNTIDKSTLIKQLYENAEKLKVSTTRTNTAMRDRFGHEPKNMTIGELLSVIQRQKQALASWQSLLNRQDVLILDTETTGLSGQDLVVDLAIIDTTGAVRFNSLVGVPTGTCISPGAMRIHGLDRHALKDAPAWPQIHDEVIMLLEDSLVCCWNAPFDRRMLHQTVAHHGLVIPQGIQWRDLLQDHRQLKPNVGSHSLEAVASRYGVRTEGSHRALPDCQTVLGVLKAYS